MKYEVGVKFTTPAFPENLTFTKPSFTGVKHKAFHLHFSSSINAKLWKLTKKIEKY